MVDQGQRSYYERPIERIYITIILKKVFHMHFAWLVQFNCIECIQAIYTFFILDVEKGEKTLQNVIFINISYGDERLTIVKSYKKYVYVYCQVVI